MTDAAVRPLRIAGRYDLGPVIGRGGTGVVRAAWDRRERRLLAAKVLPADNAALAQAAHERALELAHPHLLGTVGWVAEDGIVLLLAPLATGGSLRDQVEQAGAPPPAVVHAVLDQVLAGLAGLHERGWVHRDVTPANVLLDAGTGPWRVRLGDLGIAAPEGTPQPPGTAPGTAGFLAPEAAGGAPVDRRQDLYAVGVLGRRLLALGRPPPAARSLLAVLEQLADPAPWRRPGSADDARALLRETARQLPPAHAPEVPARATTPPAPGWIPAARAASAWFRPSRRAGPAR
ncbi:hypothetical protein GCM10022215_32330 [Nocardioides fonticola]|uniref:non-specific serine/threonine protein kinase n=1 Tax=Nocardioides fonticola TaxID=450363 RepID=A0ABP7XTR6_9ACTN